jgi:RNA polymerase sigma-70 factor (ECF subfamily)
MASMGNGSMRNRREERERHDRSQAAVVRELRARWLACDVFGVGELLSADVVVIVDGGGNASITAEPAHGIRAGRELLERVISAYPGCAVDEQSVNGRPGLVARRDGTVVAVVAVRAWQRRAVDVLIVLNPDKLRSWNSPGF